MKRTLVGLFLAGVVAALAWAAPPVFSASVYRIDLNVRLGDSIPAGALITCKVRIVPELAAGGPGLSTPMVVTGTGVATVTGSEAHCVVEVPSTWAAADAHRAAVMNYEVDAKTPGATHTVTGQGTELPGQPAGSMQQVQLNVTL